MNLRPQRFCMFKLSHAPETRSSKESQGADHLLLQSIFADASYSKPYFVTYFNIAFFILPLAPYALQRLSLLHGRKYQRLRQGNAKNIAYGPLQDADETARYSSEHNTSHSPKGTPGRRHSNEDCSQNGDIFSNPDTFEGTIPTAPPAHQLSTRATFSLAVRFSLLWFISNYFNSASLQYTTVASTTILSSTSSIFTLILGALWRVERFTWRKLLATVTCLIGVFIISHADTAGDGGDEGNFPHKTSKELTLGDAMALASAALYGVYAVWFVKTVGDESRVRMPMFFGFIGLTSIVLLWPGLVVLHWTGIEPFALPQDGRVWTVVMVNAAASLFADIAWAYALLFITPLVVTIGLSLTIPLSLVGQMLINQQYANLTYWVGALIVLSSFIFINFESKPNQEQREVSNENG